MTSTYDASSLPVGWTVQQAPSQPIGHSTNWRPSGINVVDSPKTETYDYVQTVPATTWVVDHNLDEYPLVELTGPDATNWIPDVEYVNRNTLILHFAVPTSGEAHLS